MRTAAGRQHRARREHTRAGMYTAGVAGRVQTSGMQRQAAVVSTGARMQTSSGAGVQIAGGALHAG